MTRPGKSPVPVICIGNMTAGGTGKTPACLAVLKIIKENALAQNPFFLSRGYGGALKGPVLADLQNHSHRETGDEPLLLASHAPAVISKDRYAGACLAHEQGADLVIMDDGFQNPGIEKDFSLVMIDGGRGFGNGKTLPAGPLREPLREGLRRAGAFVIAGEDRHNIRALLPENKPVFEAVLEPVNLPEPAQNYLAFCGIGNPEKFRATLEHAGLNVRDFIAFPDHHPYSQDDLFALREKAEKLNARLLTTEKDMVRLKMPDAGAPVDVLRVRMRIKPEGGFRDLLENFIKDVIASAPEHEAV